MFYVVFVDKSLYHNVAVIPFLRRTVMQVQAKLVSIWLLDYHSNSS